MLFYLELNNFILFSKKLVKEIKPFTQMQILLVPEEPKNMGAWFGERLYTMDIRLYKS